MNILITGGAGFIGSHLADLFIARGDTVTCLDTGSTRKVAHLVGKPQFRYVPDSVLNTDMLDALIARADLVYHLAAVVGVEHYVADPYAVLNVNINGTQNVLRIANKHGKKVIFSSTSEVYGRNPRVPWTEDDDRVLGSTRIDRWCYSTSKAAGEHFCFAYGRLGLPFVITRYFNVYGPRLDAIDVGRVITIFMGQVLRNEPVTVIGDGRQTRCFTYVSDAIRATAAAGLVPEAEGQVFNIGNAVETTVLELAETMIDLAGSRSEIVFVPQEKVYGQSYEDVPRRVPDCTRMHEILKVTPKISLREGLADTIAWFRQV
jgi:UDP-glucose 4-epimerase